MAWAVEHHQSRHGFVSAPLSALSYITVKTGVMGLETAVRVNLLNQYLRWDVHFGEIDDDRKDSTAPHITFRPQLGGHR